MFDVCLARVGAGLGIISAQLERATDWYLHFVSPVSAHLASSGQSWFRPLISFPCAASCHMDSFCCLSFLFFPPPRSFCILLPSSLGLYALCQFSVTPLRIDFAPRSLALTTFQAQTHLQPQPNLLRRRLYLTSIRYTDSIGDIQTHESKANLHITQNIKRHAPSNFRQRARDLGRRRTGCFSRVWRIRRIWGSQLQALSSIEARPQHIINPKLAHPHSPCIYT